MRITMLIYEPPAERNRRNDPAQAEAYWAAWGAYAAAINEAGVAVGGSGLQLPEMATTLRIRGGQRQVQDGPFADTKEQLGGFFTLEVPDLDTALLWAARCPAAGVGAIELRPNLPPPPTA